MTGSGSTYQQTGAVSGLQLHTPVVQSCTSLLSTVLTWLDSGVEFAIAVLPSMRRVLCLLTFIFATAAAQGGGAGLWEHSSMGFCKPYCQARPALGISHGGRGRLYVGSTLRPPLSRRAMLPHKLQPRTGRRAVAPMSMVRKGAAPPTWSVPWLKMASSRVWMPLTKVVTPQKLFIFMLFQIVYTRLLRLLYKLQVQVWRLVRKHDPQPYNESVLGFMEPRLRMLSRVVVIAHLLNSAVNVSIASGWKANPGLAKVLSDVVYCWYAGHFVDEAKRFFLPVWIPTLKADKRKGFIYNRSLSVLTWAICLLSVSEIISSYLRIPITSTLAFGGIGGLAIGLAGKDVLSNFFGGLMLLLAEPFIPGDMVTFQRGGVKCEGRVERVGWYQTRMRGRDTRPTYVPNGMFADTMVTNMDRITHRKFESSFQIRYSDYAKVPDVVQGIKAALKEMPNVDLMSPFRIHFVALAETGLKITTVCYFATKSFDEFLYLQQIALLEVTRVVSECGATMTSVLHVDMNDPRPLPMNTVQAITRGVVSPVAAHNAPVQAREVDSVQITPAQFEEQDSTRNMNRSIEEPHRAAGGIDRPRGGSV